MRTRVMALICQNCGTINTDPGGDPRQYRCGHCGLPQLQRFLTPDQKRVAAGVAGAAILGLATGGPAGALVGGLIGLVFGDRLLK
jgi:DNA-directed RNA polymerase subunit RPC12/RpoP